MRRTRTCRNSTAWWPRAGRSSGPSARKRATDIRLSFHPSQYVLLNGPDPELTRKSVWDLASQAEMLDRMELGPEAVIVTHVGGTYGDIEACRARWAETWPTLPEHVKRRLVLEHDDIRFSAADVLWVHERTGVRLVFDYQHLWCLNPKGLDTAEMIRRILATWPDGVRPKIHFSSPRTELREMVKVDRKTKKKVKTLRPPIWTGHADFTNPFEFARFMRDAAGLEFDIMLEGKSKDLSLLKLRPDLLRYAPDVAARFGVVPARPPRSKRRKRRWKPITTRPRIRMWTKAANGPILAAAIGGSCMSTERAVLAGGCFWGVQDLIRKQPGVVSTRVGYSGGEVPNATYRNHGNHAEAIEIIFDPARTSFRTLLEFFFQIHDPTTRNRQGNDVGASYRSAIFFTTPEQKAVAEDTIADVEASGLWPGKVVTEVAPVGDFWEAEPEHQDYLERIPNGYTCHFVRPGWKLPRRADAA